MAEGGQIYVMFIRHGYFAYAFICNVVTELAANRYELRVAGIFPGNPQQANTEPVARNPQRVFHNPQRVFRNPQLETRNPQPDLPLNP